MNKPRYVDLQIHSQYSDGEYLPKDLAPLLQKYNIKVASLVDHNTVKGVPEFMAACKRAKIKAIPGIELYVHYQQNYFHLLGYNFDLNNAFLQEQLHQVCVAKVKLLKKITPLLRKKGLTVDPEMLETSKADYIGMNNLVRHLESNPVNVKVFQKAFKKRKYERWQLVNKYFSAQNNTYFPEIYIPMKLGLQMILRAGGVPILSHPGQQLAFEQDRIILNFKKMGLAGIECFSSHHTYSQVCHYLRFAKNHDLIVTGGSDFHGDLESLFAIQRYWDYTLLPYKLYEEIKKF